MMPEEGAKLLDTSAHAFRRRHEDGFAGGQPGAWKLPLHAVPQQTTEWEVSVDFFIAYAAFEN
jgi:hypothetical protein